MRMLTILIVCSSDTALKTTGSVRNLLSGHCDNTYKDFTCSNFTFNINKCDITYMLLIYCYKESHFKVKSVISNGIISNAAVFSVISIVIKKYS